MAPDKFEIGRLDGSEEEYRFVAAKEDARRRLDQVLAGRYKWLSRSLAKRMIKEGRVFVWRAEGKARGAAVDAEAEPARPGPRDKPVKKSSFSVAENDRILLVWPRNPQDRATAEAAPPGENLEILFEDDCLIVVNKPSGVPVHPVGINLYRTVLTALHKRCVAAGVPEDRMPILAHRLDVETSGVLLAVKGEAESANVVEQFRKRTVRKEYCALVYGGPGEDRGTIELPLGAAEDSRVPYKQAVRPDGSPARTRWTVERRGRAFSLLRLLLDTGRKHQLRVHLAAIGCPIVGDKIYGPSEEYYFKAREGPPDAKDLEELILPRQALHSARLGCNHPRTGDEMIFEAPVPAAFIEILDREG